MKSIEQIFQSLNINSDPSGSYRIEGIFLKLEEYRDQGHIDEKSRQALNTKLLNILFDEASYSKSLMESFRHPQHGVQIIMKNGGDRSVKVGGSVTGAQIITGDDNNAEMRHVTVTFPPADAVDVRAELAALRGALSALTGLEGGKLGRAFDDADEEAAKAEPDKSEMGSALERALKHARTASDFADQAERIGQRLAPLIAWLGDNWKATLGKAAGLSFLV